MSPREIFTLRDYLGPELKGRSISDARRVVSLTTILEQTCLVGRFGQLAGRSVLLAVADQLISALAMIEIDGVARRMLLCPPDLNADHIETLIDDAGINARVPSEEIEALMWSESGGKQNAVSKAGALGLIQVMPANFPKGTTQAQMLDPRTNLATGTRLYAAGRGDPVQAASWYNAGGQNGQPWTNDAWLKAGRNPAQTTRWGYAAEPGYLDTFVAAYNTAVKLKRTS